MEREEYTVYPCNGKKYNNEKAIISLTSWRARINTVSKTLFSLLKQCPGFHIVLVLSEEEFPQKEKELPKDLMMFIENNLIELLWVYKNYKSFKKIIFTMDKYKEVPIISADDDCVYTCNYAEKLYETWCKNKFCCISTLNKCFYKNYQHHQGCSTLYPPSAFFSFKLYMLTKNILETNEDDIFYTILLHFHKINTIGIRLPNCFFFHDEIKPLAYLWKNKTTRNFEIILNELSKFF